MKLSIIILSLAAIITPHQITSNNQPTLIDSAYKLSLNLLQTLYQSYLYIKTTYPLNTLFVLLFTAYFIILFIKYIKRGLAGLLNNEMVYDFQPNLDSKNVGEQIKGVEKDLKEIQKFFRTAKKPSQSQQQSSISTTSNSSTESLDRISESINGLGLEGAYEDITEKNYINQRIEQEIKTGFTQIISTLKEINKKNRGE